MEDPSHATLEVDQADSVPVTATIVLNTPDRFSELARQLLTAPAESTDGLANETPRGGRTLELQPADFRRCSDRKRKTPDRFIDHYEKSLLLVKDTAKELRAQRPAKRQKRKPDAANLCKTTSTSTAKPRRSSRLSTRRSGSNANNHIDALRRSSNATQTSRLTGPVSPGAESTTTALTSTPSSLEDELRSLDSMLNDAETPDMTSESASPSAETSCSDMSNVEQSLIVGPPPIDSMLYPVLLAESKRIMHKVTIERKPEPQGSPELWATNRQALCETVLSFQSWQSACYISKGVLYSFMFDSNGDRRDLMDEHVIIARAGGGMQRNKLTGEMQQSKSQTENNQTQAVRAAIASQHPIVILCGSENSDAPIKMPHRYQALGWFKPTHIWAERSESRGETWINYKYRFEKLQTGAPSWWLPKKGDAGHSRREELSEEGALVDPITVSDMSTKRPSQSRCMAGFPIGTSSMPLEPLIGGFCYSAIMPHDQYSEGSSEYQRLEDHEDGGRYADSIQVGSDPRPIDAISLTTLLSATNALSLDGSYAAATRTSSRARKDSAQFVVDNPSTPETDPRCSDPPITFICTACDQPSEQVYLLSWMCLHPACQNFFRLASRNPPAEDALFYDPRFLKQKTEWVSEAPPHPLRPALPDPSSRIGDSVSYAMTRGMCCPQCGKCSSRSKWAGWYCECGFAHTPPHSTIPSIMLHDPWHPVGTLFSQCHDSVEACIKTTVQFSHNYRIVTYKIPDLEQCSISHLVSNRTIHEEEHGPNDMFEALQQMDCGLERRRFVNGREEYMTAYSNNRGMPYKFVAKGDSSSFDGAPWPLTETRSRLNWASRLVLGDKFTQDFNELLTIGYFDGQNIKYHDDGETGLGETVASLSLGFPADMLFRVKSKHWTGVTKAGQFVHKKPLQGTADYEKRLAMYEKLRARDADGVLRMEQAKRIAAELGLEDSVRDRKPWLRLRLSHGDMVVMHGAPLQEYFEHQVDPLGTLRFALTCRTILPHHLQEHELPEYEVGPDSLRYDGSRVADLV